MSKSMKCQRETLLVGGFAQKLGQFQPGGEERWGGRGRS